MELFSSRKTYFSVTVNDLNLLYTAQIAKICPLNEEHRGEKPFRKRFRR